MAVMDRCDGSVLDLESEGRSSAGGKNGVAEEGVVEGAVVKVAPDGIDVHVNCGIVLSHGIYRLPLLGRCRNPG
jgi:hypothetical protein